MKPFKDIRFSIAVYDNGEYSYRNSKSLLKPTQAIDFVHDYAGEIYAAYRHEGSCHACESVAQLNEKLLKKVEELEASLKKYSEFGQTVFQAGKQVFR